MGSLREIESRPAAMSSPMYSSSFSSLTLSMPAAWNVTVSSFVPSVTRSCIVAGTARVTRAAYPDPDQFDPTSHYHDPKASTDQPRWYCVDVRLDRELKTPVTLPEIKVPASVIPA